MTTNPQPSADEVSAVWQHEAVRMSTARLVHALRAFTSAPMHTPNDELVIEILTSTLLARHPEVAAAHRKWEEMIFKSKRSDEAIAAAVRGLGPRFAWLDNGHLTTGTLGHYALLWYHRDNREPGEISPEIKTWDGQTHTVRVDNIDEDLYRFFAGPHTYEETFVHNGTLRSGSLVTYGRLWHRLDDPKNTLSEVVKTWEGEVLTVATEAAPQTRSHILRVGEGLYNTAD